MDADLQQLLSSCRLCPIACGKNRLTGAGACGVQDLRIAKYYLHPFEEPCISHTNGSGTIFFCGCNLRCPYCQNFEVSRATRGKPITPQQLADIFKQLEDKGADNISLVTPSHVIPYMVQAFRLYKPKIPVVYNTGGYDSVDALSLIDEYIDVYLPDVKFYSPSLSRRYLGRSDYFQRASEAVAFMAKKPLVIQDGKLLSGLLVRHLVMPLCVSDSKAVVKWFAYNFGDKAYLSLMRQYTPLGEIANYPELSRTITAREYNAVVDEAIALGITNVFTQEKQAANEKYVPVWDY